RTLSFLAFRRARRAREEADEALQDLRQLVARQVLEDPRGDAGIAAAAAAHGDVDAVDDLAVHLDLAALEPDVGGVMVAARGGTAGPADGEGPYAARLLQDFTGERHRARLRIDQGQVAEVRARARDEPALHLGRVVGQRLEQRLLRQVADPRVGDVRNEHVL